MPPIRGNDAERMNPGSKDRYFVEPATKLYKPLAKGWFRVIEFDCQPYDTGEGLRCSLIEYPLKARDQDVVEYHALSYTWGLPGKSEIIYINGSEVGITWNLYYALYHLRSKHTRLWVDALCINQSDIAEREEQVQEMGSIYRCASNVVVWLGEATVETHELMAALNSHQHTTSAGQPLDGSSTVVSWNEQWRDRSNTILQFTIGLKILLARAWFTRVWVIQEITLAKSILIYAGSDSITGRIFALTPALLGVKPEEPQLSMLEIMRKDSTLRDSNLGEVAATSLLQLLKKFRRSQASEPRDRIFALLGLCQHPDPSLNFRTDYKSPESEIATRLSSFLFGRMYPKGRTSITGLLHKLEYHEQIQRRRLPRSIKKELLSCVKQEVDGLERLQFFFRHRSSTEALSSADDIDFDIILRRCLSNQRTGAFILELLLRNLHGIIFVDRHMLRTVMDHMHCESILQTLFRPRVDPRMEIRFSSGLLLDVLDLVPHTMIMRIFDQVTVASLVAKGLKVDLRARDGSTLLYQIATRNMEDIVIALLNHGAPVDAGRLAEERWLEDLGKTLHAVSNYGHVNIVKLLLDSGTRINAKALAKQLRQEDLGRALQAASYHGHEDIVKLLLARGANVNARSDHFVYPLQLFSEGGYIYVTQRTVANGLLIDTPGRAYGSALEAAICQGRDRISAVLMRHGADINTVSREDGSPLHLASSLGYLHIAGMLIAKGADVNIQGGKYGNALQAAVAGNHNEIIETLIANGADVNAQGGYYGNALMAAAVGERWRLVEVLLRNGAFLLTDMDAPDFQAYGAERLVRHMSLRGRSTTVVRDRIVPGGVMKVE